MAEFLCSMGERFGRLPHEVLDAPVVTLQWLAIEAMGRPEAGGEMDPVERPRERPPEMDIPMMPMGSLSHV